MVEGIKERIEFHQLIRVHLNHLRHDGLDELLGLDFLAWYLRGFSRFLANRDQLLLLLFSILLRLFDFVLELLLWLRSVKVAPLFALQHVQLLQLLFEGVLISNLG